MKLYAESYLKTGSNELRVLEFRIENLSFGINILKVSKIINERECFTQVPDSGEAVAGMFRDRDQVIPLVDTAKHLGLSNSSVSRDKVIVTEFFGKVTGFLVDRVDWIHHFVWDDIIDAENVFGGIDHPYVIGLVKPTEDRLVQLLDYESILLELCPNLSEKARTTYTGKTNFTGRRVLIAEDSPSVRTMLVTELSDLGFEVIPARDGMQAWEIFQKERDELVISDVEMPRVDGLALTLNIRQSERPDTPVIVYSSIGDEGMKSRAAFLKADAHVTKLNLDELMSTVEKLLSGDPLPSSNSVEMATDVAEEEEITTIVPI